MLEALWQQITPYFFILIAIPCMGMFLPRYHSRKNALATVLTVLLACLAKAGLLWLSRQFLPGSFWFGASQYIFFLCIMAGCLFLYRGKPASMALMILLALSLAIQLGFVVGGILTFFYGPDYPVALIALRDVIGYGVFTLFYVVLRLRMNIESLYLSLSDHLVLLFLAFAGHLMTCLYASLVGIDIPSTIPVYLSSLFATCSMTYLIIRFTREHQKSQEQQLLIQEMRLADNTLTQVQESLSQMRELKHELGNYSVYARELLKEGDYQALDTYLGNFSQKVLLSTEVVSTSSPVVNAMLNQKNAYARSLGIETSMQVSLPEHLPFDDLTLCSLFGNLLNNAIEACQGQPHPRMRLSVKPVKSYLAIALENSVLSDVVAENPGLATTKDDASGHGIGLRVLKRIVAEYDGILHYEMSGDNLFTVKVLLCLE